MAAYPLSTPPLLWRPGCAAKLAQRLPAAPSSSSACCSPTSYPSLSRHPSPLPLLPPPPLLLPTGYQSQSITPITPAVTVAQFLRNFVKLGSRFIVTRGPCWVRAQSRQTPPACLAELTRRTLARTPPLQHQALRETSATARTPACSTRLLLAIVVRARARHAHGRACERTLGC